MNNFEEIRSLLEDILILNKTYIDEQVQLLHALSEVFASKFNIDKNNYTKLENIFKTDNGEIVMHISYEFNHVNHVVYVLSADNEENCMSKYANNTYNVLKPKNNDCCFIARTCYGYGSWGTDMYDKNCNLLNHDEKRESFGCCCD